MAPRKPGKTSPESSASGLGGAHELRVQGRGFNVQGPSLRALVEFVRTRLEFGKFLGSSASPSFIPAQSQSDEKPCNALKRPYGLVVPHIAMIRYSREPFIERSRTSVQDPRILRIYQ